ncbi:MAG TPA: helix-turn-helix domain-containing protein [Acidimicrobiales bacterium]
MARWEPDARLRLVRAALDLFTERGYDDTTIVEIAERAGLTKSTFFRYFPDKRDVLIAGQDALSRSFAEGIASAPATATPLEAVACALDAAAAVLTPDIRELGPQLRAVVAANRELQDRDALKRTSLAAVLADALRQRGIEAAAASLAGELGVLAFSRAHSMWADPANQRHFSDLARQALDELRRAIATLD